jgi:hypothetical protein
MVRTFLKVYVELGSYFLFLQEQIKDIIILKRGGRPGGGENGVREPGECVSHDWGLFRVIEQTISSWGILLIRHSRNT